MSDQPFNEHKPPSPAADPGSATYYSWLLRLWREHPTEEWRVVLQRADGERIGFPGLDALFVFLLYLTHVEESTK